MLCFRSAEKMIKLEDKAFSLPQNLLLTYLCQCKDLTQCVIAEGVKKLRLRQKSWCRVAWSNFLGKN